MESDDDLKYLFAMAFESGVPTDDCPPAERLLDAFQGELNRESFAEVVDHTSACSVCAEAWRLAKLSGLRAE